MRRLSRFASRGCHAGVQRAQRPLPGVWGCPPETYLLLKYASGYARADTANCRPTRNCRGSRRPTNRVAPAPRTNSPGDILNCELDPYRCENLSRALACQSRDVRTTNPVAETAKVLNDYITTHVSRQARCKKRMILARPAVRVTATQVDAACRPMRRHARRGEHAPIAIARPWHLARYGMIPP